MFIDTLAKVNKPSRNKIITDWLAFLDHDNQVRLINKLKDRGIEYQPKENTRYFENS
jgi:hypothetical protein